MGMRSWRARSTGTEEMESWTVELLDPDAAKNWSNLTYDTLAQAPATQLKTAWTLKSGDLAPRKINVYSLELLEWSSPEAVIDVFCSSGTYVRSLANDLGTKLGCGAHLVGLRRTKSGRFTLRDAVPLRRLQEAFTAGNWYKYLIPAAEALGDWPAVELDADQVELVRHGHRVPGEAGAQGWARGISEQGDLVALMEFDAATSEWQPKKVFFQS